MFEQTATSTDSGLASECGIGATSRARLVARVILLAAIAIAATQAFYYFARLVDDAFISLRYAERLVDGRGLTFNNGAFVEGFSNPLWVALQALLISVGVDGVIATKVLSLSSISGLFIVLHGYCRSVLRLSPIGCSLALLLLACSSYVLSWSMWGLETPLFLLLLVLTMTSTHRLVTSETRRAGVSFVVCTVLLISVRPEAPLYVVAMLLGTVVDCRSRQQISRILVRLVPWLLLVALLVATLLLVRLHVFGKIFAQTYYAKQGVGLKLENLLPLVGMGASPWEVIVAGLSICAAAMLAWRKRTSAVALVIAVNFFFVASVAVDWMPNQRHFLPFFVLACPLTALSADYLISRLAFNATFRRAVGALMFVLLAGFCLSSFVIDSRYSIYDFRSHGRGKDWILPKNSVGWETAWHANSRVPPYHISQMSVHSMGMVDQVFRIIESARIDEEESWYIGRDIGLVGYVSPVQIYDTDALFTPELTSSPSWRAAKNVDREVLRDAFQRRPVATDLLDDWPRALSEDRETLATLDILVGDVRRPIAVRAREHPRPTPEQIIARYERVVEKVKLPFFIGTLYGENVGAAIEKRADWIVRQLKHLTPMTIPAQLLPVRLRGRGLIDNSIEALGCRVVTVDRDRILECFFRTLAEQTRAWTVFVHGTDARGEGMLFNADHAPCGGWLGTDQWKVGEVIRDAVVLPADYAASSIRYGLFIGRQRAKTSGEVDAHGRIIGPDLP